jgi:hypothetical protein
MRWRSAYPVGGPALVVPVTPATLLLVAAGVGALAGGRRIPSWWSAVVVVALAAPLGVTAVLAAVDRPIWAVAAILLGQGSRYGRRDRAGCSSSTC